MESGRFKETIDSFNCLSAPSERIGYLKSDIDFHAGVPVCFYELGRQANSQVVN